MAPNHMSAVEDAKCQATFCHPDYNKGPWPNVTTYRCPDEKFSQFGCDINGNHLDINNHIVPAPKNPHLMTRDMSFTDLLKHGHSKGWVLAFIIVGMILALVLMGFFVLVLRARKRVSQRKKIVVDAGMKEIEEKQAGIEVVEEEYSDFLGDCN